MDLIIETIKMWLENKGYVVDVGSDYIAFDIDHVRYALVLNTKMEIIEIFKHPMLKAEMELETADWENPANDPIKLVNKIWRYINDECGSMPA